jgi:hypothetical protein
VPLISSSFRSPFWLPGGHLQTLVPVLIDRPKYIEHKELVIDTPDGDFLEADYYQGVNGKLAILSHGLEGHSRTRYIMGMTKALLENKWSVLAWNFRACGSRMNRLLSMYHSGKSEDLDTVIRYGIAKLSYKNIALIGFSVGGNITLKYLGEKGADLPREITAAAAVSPPCDLGASGAQLARPLNFIYMQNFLQSLRDKIRRKSEQFPGQIDLRPLSSIRTFKQFDDAYTAPLNRFKNADDYYTRCSSIGYLDQIKIPTLILTAKNDPFLPEECYPLTQARQNENLYLEMPGSGGHVGFISRAREGTAWPYRHILQFLQDF